MDKNQKTQDLSVDGKPVGSNWLVWIIGLVVVGAVIYGISKISGGSLLATLLSTPVLLVLWYLVTKGQGWGVKVKGLLLVAIAIAMLNFLAVKYPDWMEKAGLEGGSSVEQQLNKLNRLGPEPPTMKCDYYHWVDRDYEWESFGPKDESFPKFSVPNRMQNFSYSMSAGLFCGVNPKEQEKKKCPKGNIHGNKQWELWDGMLDPIRGSMYVFYPLTKIAKLTITFEVQECHEMIHNLDHDVWLQKKQALAQIQADQVGGGGQVQAKLNNGTSSPAEEQISGQDGEKKTSIPWWIWVILGVVVVAAIVFALLFFGTKEDSQWMIDNGPNLITEAEKYQQQNSNWWNSVNRQDFFKHLEVSEYYQPAVEKLLRSGNLWPPKC